MASCSEVSTRINPYARRCQKSEEGAAGRSCWPPGQKETFRTRNRSVRRVAQRLHRIARRKGEKARRELKEAYQKLITITQASCTQAKRVIGVLGQQDDDDCGAGRLLEHLEHFLGLVEQGIAQAARRVLHDEQVPAAERRS